LLQAGGEYVYLKRTYDPFVGFLAAGAVSFTAYFLEVISPDGEPGLTVRGLVLFLVWIVTGFHLAGAGPGGWLQQLLAVLNVGATLCLIMGALMSGTGSWGHLGVADPEIKPGLGTVGVSLTFVAYAYSGWNAAAYIAGEVIDPGRILPRSLLWGTLLVGLLYLGLNVVYCYALPVTALAQAPVLPVAAKAAVALFGGGGVALVSGLLCLSIAGAVTQWCGRGRACTTPWRETASFRPSSPKRRAEAARRARQSCSRAPGPRC
jgi:APA family basic amino acid/polyamine antiporter